MANYINTQTLEYPFTEWDIKQLYPNTSFGSPFVAPEPFEPVQDEPMPPYDSMYEGCKEVSPVKTSGAWVQTYEVYPLTPEQIANNEANAKDANKNQASALLSETDWVELGDAANPANPPYLTNKADFTAYRQQLRTIAINPPITVDVWPVKPEEVWGS